MFTGIVKETGPILRLEKRSGLWKLGIRSEVVYNRAEVSDSIAVNGVCLTVVEKKGQILYFEAVKPTVELTTIKRLTRGSLVNLEPALSVGDKLGGHYVLGHVDCESTIKTKLKQGDYWRLEIKFPAQFESLLVNKGSVAVDGISLTVAEVKTGYFTVNVIPHTHAHTGLKDKRAGDWVNLEFDYLLKSRQKS